jgi:hypothetical protein
MDHFLHACRKDTKESADFMAEFRELSGDPPQRQAFQEHCGRTCCYLAYSGAYNAEILRFRANGFAVSERISAMASVMAPGARTTPPYDPSPPKFETAAVSRCE